MRKLIVTAMAMAALAACSTTPTTRSLVTGSAPRVSEFRFDAAPPLGEPDRFAPWATLLEASAASADALERCIAARDACETGGLVRYRRLIELAAGLEPDEQLRLVQEYFNSVDQKLQATTADWATLYRTAALHEGDCKAIALGKYFTLRRLGWAAEDLRVVMGWDDREFDWHALVAVRLSDRTFILDSILGPQDPRAFDYGYMVYSISDIGIWDHAPDFVPVP